MEEFDIENIDPEDPIKPGVEYTPWQLEQITNAILKHDSKRELCRDCEGYGRETGEAKVEQQFEEDGSPITDDEGHNLFLKFPEYRCINGHSWFKGEGKSRTIQGRNPILFEEHMISRKRREIYNSLGYPDPSIVSGLYHRTHPQGRKVNSEEARKKHGASFYR